MKVRGVKAREESSRGPSANNRKKIKKVKLEKEQRRDDAE